MDNKKDRRVAVTDDVMTRSRHRRDADEERNILCRALAELGVGPKIFSILDSCGHICSLALSSCPIAVSNTSIIHFGATQLLSWCACTCPRSRAIGKS